MTDIKLNSCSSGCDYVTEDVSAEIAWGLLQCQRQDNHVQQWVGDREGHQPRPAASDKSLKKPDRSCLDIDITEREWRIFEDCWAR